MVPSQFSAESIMPWLTRPFLNSRGARLAMKSTCLPTSCCGSYHWAMPLTMVRPAGVPSSILNLRSFFILGTRSHSKTVPTRMSTLPKSSKPMVSLTGDVSALASALALMTASSLSIWNLMTSSSILEKSRLGLLSCLPEARRSVLPRSSQLRVSMQIMSRSLADENGRKGSKAMARLAVSWREM